MAFNTRKFIDYSLNGLLILIVLILLIPSWRIGFQGWFQSLFMAEAEFSRQTEELIPKEARNWALFNMNDALTNFNDLSGKPILLSFWATWCPPCRAELPELNDLQTEFDGQLQVIAVSEESIEVIKNSRLHQKYTFLYSTPGVPAFYQIDSYPTLLIIDKHMQIVYRNKGAADLTSVENRTFLKNLISEE